MYIDNVYGEKTQLNFSTSLLHLFVYCHRERCIFCQSLYHALSPRLDFYYSLKNSFLFCIGFVFSPL